MDKLKNLLNPGHKSDSDALYGSGQGPRSVIDSLSSQNPQPQGLQSSATSPPKPSGTSGPPEAASSADAKDFARSTQDPLAGGGEEHHSSLSTGRSEATQADARLLDTGEGDRLSGGQHDASSVVSEDRSLRPQLLAGESAASNASIKSNVIGKTPSGTAYAQPQGELPPVPATDGKFMHDEATIVGGPASQLQTSSKERSLPLVGSHTAADSTQQTAPRHQTALADRLDLNLDSTSERLHTADGKSISEKEQESHLGQNFAVLGAAGATGTGIYAATQGSDHPTQATLGGQPQGGSSSFAPALSALTGDRDTPGSSSTPEQGGSNKFASALSPITGSGIGSTSAGGPTKAESSEFAPALSAITESTSSRSPAASTALNSSAGPAGTASSYDSHVSTGSRQMPGAYPETPALESDKRLGSDVTGVGSGAALIAAQRAYGQSSSAQPAGDKVKTHATSKPVTQTPAYVSTHKVEPSPYGNGIDPRVAPSDRSDVSKSAAGLAAVTGVAAGSFASEKSTTGPKGTLSEKIQEAQAREPQSGLAPTSAATASSSTPSQSGGLSQSHETREDAIAPTGLPASTIASDTARSSVQGTHFEDPDNTKAGDDDHTSRYALAGAAAAATGAGAYGAAQHRDRDDVPTVRHDFSSIREEPLSERTEPVSTESHVSGTTTSHAERATTNHDHVEPTGTNDKIVAGAPITSPSEHNTTGQHPTEREFPLAASHGQEPATNTTNFSYPTGVKESAPQTSENFGTSSRSDYQSKERSFPKDAAETGAAGLGGAAAYEALRHEEPSSSISRTPDFDDPLASSAHPGALESYDDQRAVPSHDIHTTGHEPIRHSESEAAYGHRDVALVGAGAVGGGAAAGLASSQFVQDDKLERERAKTAERKHAEHEKHTDKIRKSEDKSRRSEDKSRPKSDDKEHKHGLIHRLLHRHKSKESLDKENEPRGSYEKTSSSLDRPSYEQPSEPTGAMSQQQTGGQVGDRADLPSSDYAGDSLPVGSNSGTSEHLKHGRHVLYKDPPPGVQANHP